MRKQLSRLLALALCACLLLGTAAHAAGTEPAVTRGQFIQELYDAYQARKGYPGTTDPVAWASALGVVQGYADGSIRTDAAITRTQMAVMLYRYAAMTIKNAIPPVLAQGILDGYTDAASVPAWAGEQVKWAVSKGLWLSGSATRLGPGDRVSRAECETAVMAIYLKDGAVLETDWNNYNVDPDVKLTVDACASDKVTFTIQNSGTGWLEFEEESRLHRKVNGSWYALDLDRLGKTAGYTSGPGYRKTWEQTYWEEYRQIFLPAGEYRLVQKTQRGLTPHSDKLHRTECRLSADFTVS